MLSFTDFAVPSLVEPPVPVNMFDNELRNPPVVADGCGVAGTVDVGATAGVAGTAAGARGAAFFDTSIGIVLLRVFHEYGVAGGGVGVTVGVAGACGNWGVGASGFGYEPPGSLASGLGVDLTAAVEGLTEGLTGALGAVGLADAVVDLLGLLAILLLLLISVLFIAFLRIESSPEYPWPNTELKSSRTLFVIVVVGNFFSFFLCLISAAFRAFL